MFQLKTLVSPSAINEYGLQIFFSGKTPKENFSFNCQRAFVANLSCNIFQISEPSKTTNPVTKFVFKTALSLAGPIQSPVAPPNYSSSLERVTFGLSIWSLPFFGFGSDKKEKVIVSVIVIANEIKNGIIGNSKSPNVRE